MPSIYWPPAVVPLASCRPFLSDLPGIFCRHLGTARANRLVELFTQVRTATSEAAHFHAGLGYLLLTAWSAYQAASAIPLEDVHPAVQSVAQLIHHGNHTGDLSALAEDVGLNPFSLSRLFKSQTGVTLTTFRNRCRVERFLEVYGEGQATTMLAAALDAGFGSYAQFYRVFRQVTGVTPAVYRRNLRDGYSGTGLS